MFKLEDYRGIVSDGTLYAIYQKARKLYGKRIVHINSTYHGGGVAEILNSLVPLMNEVGVEAGWRNLRGNPDFFTITKKFHNALQGQHSKFSRSEQKLYVRTNADFAVYTHIDHDLVIIHDPQPLPLIQFYRKKQPWIWRCHIDIKGVGEPLALLKKFILRYDRMIVSSEEYILREIPVHCKVIAPAIDPSTLKNAPLTRTVIDKTLERYRIPTDKPLVTQISRFDKWKDPEGVLAAFRLIKEKVDCRLVLCGSMASDDPEGIIIYEVIKRRADDLIKAGDVLFTTVENNILVNALQRVSSVIFQKSLKEGFGLTVTEALWKGKPVIASKVGGIPLQIDDGINGFLVDPKDIQGCADRAVEILKKPKLAEDLGRNAIEKVRHNFLMTRLLSDYLDLINEELS
ncbi:MAG: glycosyltransferase [bacterium]